MKILRILLRLMPVILLTMVFTGCAEAPPQRAEETERIWPLPPDIPRIKYIKSFSHTYDVEDPPGFLDRIGGVTFYSLQAPQGVAADRDGNIYVADSTKTGIPVFKPSKKKLDFIGGADITERISVPIGLAIAHNSNMLLAANAGSKKVIGFDLKTYAVKLAVGGFENPVGVAVDEKRGRIYVTDSKASELKAFDMSGRYVTTIAKRGAEDHQLAVPSQVSLDKHGNIYVADLFNFKVKIFSPEGKLLKTIGHGPCTGLGCFSKLNGVAVDSDDNIYAVDTDFGNVQIFNQNGELLMPLGGIGSAPGAFFLPMHIYIDENDRIYVADTFNFRVQVFQYLKDEIKQGK